MLEIQFYCYPFENRQKVILKTHFKFSNFAPRAFFFIEIERLHGICISIFRAISQY